MQKPLSILFCIMDWGIGHATRSSVLIDELLRQNVAVQIASSGAAKAWLEQKYPSVKVLEKPSFTIQYPVTGSITWAIIKQTPALIQISHEEQDWVSKLHQIHSFNAILSDNCYGCYHNEIVSVIITHQLNLPLSNPSKLLAQQVLNQQLKNFDIIWVPDSQNSPRLSGELSHSTDPRVQYIGPVSRFQLLKHLSIRDGWVALASGPEPRRTIFEKELFNLLSRWPGKHHLFTGSVQPMTRSSKKVQVHSLNNSKAIAETIQDSKGLICRSGYSTLMDITSFNLPVVLVPTEGQAEQEHLAEHWKNHFGATIAKVEELSTLEPHGTPPNTPENTYNLKRIIIQFLEQLASKDK